MLNVRTTTQINHRSTSVDGGGGAVRNLVVDKMNFERIVLNSRIRNCDSKSGQETHRKHLEKLRLGDHQSLELLLLLDDGFGERFQRWIIGRKYHSMKSRRISAVPD